VAAEKVLQELSAGTLESVVLGDSDAGRLDDFQIVCRSADGLNLDAYQVKWSAKEEVIGDAEFRDLLADALEGLSKIRAKRDRPDVSVRIARFRAHVYSNRPPSSAGLRGEFAGLGLSVARFLDDVWNSAIRGQISSLNEVPSHWRDYVNVLAGRSSLKPEELLRAAPEILFELRQALPEEKAPHDREGDRFIHDVREIAAGMKRLVIDGDRPSDLPVLDFLQAPGPEWAGRRTRRSEHEFPLSRGMKPIEGAIGRLQKVLDSNRGGYISFSAVPVRASRRC
jgi:hypothetical protein